MEISILNNLGCLFLCCYKLLFIEKHNENMNCIFKFDFKLGIWF